MRKDEMNLRASRFAESWTRRCLLAGLLLLLGGSVANAIVFTVNDYFLGQGQFEITPRLGTGWGERIIAYPYIDHAQTDPFASTPSGHLPNGEAWILADVRWTQSPDMDEGENYHLWASVTGDSGQMVTEHLWFREVGGTIVDCQISSGTDRFNPTTVRFTPIGTPTLDPYECLDFLFAQSSQHSVPDGGSSLLLLSGALATLGALRARFRRTDL